MEKPQMCHIEVAMISGKIIKQKNIMLGDISISDLGISVTTQLGRTIYHNPNIEKTYIHYINEDDEP